MHRGMRNLEVDIAKYCFQRFSKKNEAIYYLYFTRILNTAKHNPYIRLKLLLKKMVNSFHSSR